MRVCPHAADAACAHAACAHAPRLSLPIHPQPVLRVLRRHRLPQSVHWSKVRVCCAHACMCRHAHAGCWKTRFSVSADIQLGSDLVAPASRSSPLPPPPLPVQVHLWLLLHQLVQLHHLHVLVRQQQSSLQDQPNRRECRGDVRGLLRNRRGALPRRLLLFVQQRLRPELRQQVLQRPRGHRMPHLPHPVGPHVRRGLVPAGQLFLQLHLFHTHVLSSAAAPRGAPWLEILPACKSVPLRRTLVCTLRFFNHCFDCPVLSTMIVHSS